MFQPDPAGGFGARKEVAGSCELAINRDITHQLPVKTAFLTLTCVNGLFATAIPKCVESPWSSRTFSSAQNNVSWHPVHASDDICFPSFLRDVVPTYHFDYRRASGCTS